MSRNALRGRPAKDRRLSVLASILTSEITLLANAAGFTSEDIENALNLGNFGGRKWRRYQAGQISMEALILNVVSRTIEEDEKISLPKRHLGNKQLGDKSPWLDSDWRALFNPSWYDLHRNGVSREEHIQSALQSLADMYEGDLTLDWLKELAARIGPTCESLFYRIVRQRAAPEPPNVEWVNTAPRYLPRPTAADDGALSEADRIMSIVAAKTYYNDIENLENDEHQANVELVIRAKTLLDGVGVALRNARRFGCLVPPAVAKIPWDETLDYDYVVCFLSDSGIDPHQLITISAVINLLAQSIDTNGSISYRDLLVALTPPERRPSVLDPLRNVDSPEWDDNE